MNCLLVRLRGSVWTGITLADMGYVGYAISIMPCLMSLQTLERRRKIAEKNRHRDPDTWDTIKRIINRLDVDGMSGDETDTPLGVNPKIVRRVALPWISTTITDLLHAVESYAPATYEENMSVPIGNTSLPRLVAATRTAQNSVAIARLPRNWYDDRWYKANSSSARTFLDARADFEVPSLVRHFTLLNLMCYSSCDRMFTVLLVAAAKIHCCMPNICNTRVAKTPMSYYNTTPSFFPPRVLSPENRNWSSINTLQIHKCESKPRLVLSVSVSAPLKAPLSGSLI